MQINCWLRTFHAIGSPCTSSVAVIERSSLILVHKDSSIKLSIIHRAHRSPGTIPNFHCLLTIHTTLHIFQTPKRFFNSLHSGYGVEDHISCISEYDKRLSLSIGAFYSANLLVLIACSTLVGYRREFSRIDIHCPPSLSFRYWLIYVSGGRW